LEARPRRSCFGFRILAGTASRARCVGGVGVPDLEVLEHGVGQFDPGAPPLAVEHSTCIRDQNDSIMALSKQSAMLPMDGTSPGGRGPIGERPGPELTGLNRSEWITAPGGGLRRSIAMLSALVTRAAVGEASIDQPTTRRE
jgi:hypothetical protein